MEVTRLRLFVRVQYNNTNEKTWFRALKLPGIFQRAVTCAVLNEIETIDIISQKYWYFFKETPESMISSIWYRYQSTPIYDLWMSWIICQFSLKVMSFSGCLWSVISATSATVFHPLASLALHTLLVGLAGSRTNGRLRGKTQHFSLVSCRKWHWHYSYY